jgi:hypothetical protein
MEQCISTKFTWSFFFNLSVPMLLNPVGDPLSGNGCGSPNHIKYVISLFTQFIPDN